MRLVTTFLGALVTMAAVAGPVEPGQSPGSTFPSPAEPPLRARQVRALLAEFSTLDTDRIAAVARRDAALADRDQLDLEEAFLRSSSEQLLAEIDTFNRACGGRVWSDPAYQRCPGEQKRLDGLQAELLLRFEDYTARTDANASRLASEDDRLDTIDGRLREVGEVVGTMTTLVEMGPCQPGDPAVLLRCVTVTWNDLVADCARIERQLTQDRTALVRQQENLLQGNAELQAWRDLNAKAERDALLKAELFLVEGLIGKLGEIQQTKLARVEAELRRRAPLGETWTMKLERFRRLEASANRLSNAAGALTLAAFPVKPALESWLAITEWAQQYDDDVDTIDAVMLELRDDPELAHILTESGVTFVVGSLKLLLGPFANASLSLGAFLVNYGYDATAWVASRNRILQAVGTRDRAGAIDAGLQAVASLSRQMDRTVARLRVCRDNLSH